MLDMASFAAPKQLPNPSLQSLDTARSRAPADSSNSGRQHPNLQQQQQQQRNYESPNPAADDEFHLAIPRLLTQNGRTLSQMDQTQLAECLQPVMGTLRSLNAESLLGLERVENGARLCDGINVRPIHDEVFPKYDSFGGMSFVRYVHITEIPEQYSVGIFIFPPFSRIPLHDHPEMCVLSRLLYGDLQCLSLDLPDGSSDDTSGGKMASHQQQRLFPQSMMQQQSRMYGHQPLHATEQPPQGLPPGSCRAYKNPIKHLHAPDVSMLFPYKGNLHEFFAGPNGAAVLDILLPPYDVENERDCTFYDIREDPVAAAVAAAATVNPQQPSAMVIDGGLGDALDQNDARKPCWIVPTVQPHDFHCLSGKYHKLGANVLSMQNTS